jgi:hypothetical protein
MPSYSQVRTVCCVAAWALVSPASGQLVPPIATPPATQPAVIGTPADALAQMELALRAGDVPRVSQLLPEPAGSLYAEMDRSLVQVGIVKQRLIKSLDLKFAGASDPLSFVPDDAGLRQKIQCIHDLFLLDQREDFDRQILNVTVTRSVSADHGTAVTEQYVAIEQDSSWHVVPLRMTRGVDLWRKRNELLQSLPTELNAISDQIDVGAFANRADAVAAIHKIVGPLDSPAEQPPLSTAADNGSHAPPISSTSDHTASPASPIPSATVGNQSPAPPFAATGLDNAAQTPPIPSSTAGNGAPGSPFATTGLDNTAPTPATPSATAGNAPPASPFAAPGAVNATPASPSASTTGDGPPATSSFAPPTGGNAPAPAPTAAWGPEIIEQGNLVNGIAMPKDLGRDWSGYFQNVDAVIKQAKIAFAKANPGNAVNYRAAFTFDLNSEGLVQSIRGPVAHTRLDVRAAQCIKDAFAVNKKVFQFPMGTGRMFQPGGRLTINFGDDSETLGARIQTPYIVPPP